MNTPMSRQLLRFGVAGVIGLLVDTGVLYALAPWLGWYGARVLSFLAAASTTWWINRRWAFAAAAPHAPARSAWRQYGKYLLSMSLGGTVNYAVYAITLQSLTAPGTALVGVALGSCAGLVFNFSAARWVVFRHPPNP